MCIRDRIVRSPGIYYKSEATKQNSRVYTASLISNRGTWVKFEIDKDDISFLLKEAKNQIQNNNLKEYFKLKLSFYAFLMISTVANT